MKYLVGFTLAWISGFACGFAVMHYRLARQFRLAADEFRKASQMYGEAQAMAEALAKPRPRFQGPS